MQLYNFRHCWAIRSIRESAPTGLAARCMGHDIAVHTRTYHRWLERADVAAFIASRNRVKLVLRPFTPHLQPTRGKHAAAIGPGSSAPTSNLPVQEYSQ